MEFWDSVSAGIELLARWDVFAFLTIGLILGVLVGAMPGLTTAMAIAILLPLSFFWDPLVGIPFLIGVYKGGIYGGSVPAILIATPGTGASVATTFDGPALARKGQARKALEMSLYASVIGDLSSDVFTLLLIVPVAMVALLIGPPELSAIVVLSLIVVILAGNGPLGKGLVMAFLGLLLSTIGQDPLEFTSRFTFGIDYLKSGIPLLPMLIGLFALPEILRLIEHRMMSGYPSQTAVETAGDKLSLHEFRRCGRSIFRSSVIGTLLGMIPGVGQPTAAFTGYAAAKNASGHAERFGKGELEGIAAAEAANNAVNGPTLVPLLTLGIPGDKITAILLGAFVAHGLRPGPQLIADHGPTVFAILVAMALANVILLVVARILIPLMTRLVRLDSALLIPIVLLLAFTGAYLYRSDPMDLNYVIIFGVFGFISRKLGYDISPLVMAFILGETLEYSIGQTLNMASGSLAGYLLSERPIAGILYLLIPVVVGWFAYLSRRRRKCAGNTPRESLSNQNLIK